MKTYLYVAVFAIIAFIVLRYAPVDHEEFHDDPAEPDPQRAEVRLIGLDAPRFPAPAAEVLEEFAAIALRDQGVHIAAGDLDEGMITFVARSKILGLRDYITVKAVDEVGASKLAILARPKGRLFGGHANAARLDRWLQELSHTFEG